MNGNAQLGAHPDAESLNAFVEQALAGKEREQIVAHLAICSGCREVVFLLQSANAGMNPAMHAAPANMPWWRSWRMAWIPAGALAASISIAFMLHIRQQEPARQLARVEKQGRPVASITQSPPLPNTAESAKKANPEQKIPKPLARGNQPLEMAEAPPPSRGASAPLRMNEGVLQKTVGAADELKGAQPELTTHERQGPNQAALSTQQASVAASPALERPAAAPPPEVSTIQAELTGAQVAKSSASRARTSDRSFALLRLEKAKLPSGLAAVSSAALKKNSLAVDKEGNVFLSVDGGADWESIGRQWNGKAVAVRAVPEQSEFELVNDQGQVWRSEEGRDWKLK